MLSEMQMGRSRVDALREMAERVDIAEVTSFVAAILQANQLGVTVLDTLHSQGRLLRQRYRQNLEKEAHQAGVKMLIPLVFFMFPALTVIEHVSSALASSVVDRATDLKQSGIHHHRDALLLDEVDGPPGGAYPHTPTLQGSLLSSPQPRESQEPFSVSLGYFGHPRPLIKLL
ncbi:MAG: type II secretion system F family protein [Chloroflexi bacterium]|nr:type II secretion system F family protein [Chloroflexota bacterium]